MVKHTLELWASVYANHAALRTGVEFLHIAGLVVGGGSAVVVDRSTLAAARADEGVRAAQLATIRSAHRIVIGGLAILFATGLLLFAADVDTFLPSKTFWLKIGLVATLDRERGNDVDGPTTSRTRDITGLASVALCRGYQPGALVPDGAGRNRPVQPRIAHAF